MNLSDVLGWAQSLLKPSPFKPSQAQPSHWAWPGLGPGLLDRKAQSPGVDGSIIYLLTPMKVIQRGILWIVNNIQIICDQSSDFKLCVLCMTVVLHYEHCHLLLIVIDNTYALKILRVYVILQHKKFLLFAASHVLKWQASFLVLFILYWHQNFHTLTNNVANSI